VCCESVCLSFCFDYGSLSPDATWLAVAVVNRVTMYHWTGSEYAVAWTTSPPPYLSVTCLTMSSPVSSTVPLVAVGFSNNQQGTWWAVGAYDGANGTTLWLYTSPESSGTYIDAAFAIATTDQGEAVVLGSWGDDRHVNPTLHVFAGWPAIANQQPRLLLNYTTPGSIMDVSCRMSTTEANRVEVGVAALQTHENVGFTDGIAFAFAVNL
jgi:hypothetical protein